MKPVDTPLHTHTTNSLVIKVRIQNVNTMIFLMDYGGALGTRFLKKFTVEMRSNDN